MPNTYTLIASNTVGSGGVSSVTFSSIPSTYTDLLLKISTRTNRSAVTDGLEIRLNGATTNHSGRRLTGDGSAAASSVSVYGNTDGNTATASTFGNAEVYIPNYAGSNYKSFSMDTVSENNATANGMTLNANLWSQTTAVSSIEILMSDGTLFNQYSTFYLYGIKNT
jgi:hypothetical protein